MTYRLWVHDEAKAEMHRLPGDVRQRLQREVFALTNDPRPSNSRELRSPERLEVEARRMRVADWRVIYIVDEVAFDVGILAVRKRPPYDYRDLPQLLSLAE